MTAAVALEAPLLESEECRAPTGPVEFGEWRAMAQLCATLAQVQRSPWAHKQTQELFPLLARMAKHDQELEPFWADYLIDLMRGVGITRFQLCDHWTGPVTSAHLWTSDAERGRNIEALTAGHPQGFNRLVTALAIEAKEMLSMQQAGGVARWPNLRSLNYEAGPSWRPVDASYQEATLHTIACAASRLHSFYTRGVLVNLDPILRACPLLRVVGGALPMRETGAQITRLSLMQADLYSGEAQAEKARRLALVGELESLQITELREVTTRPAHDALATLSRAHGLQARALLVSELHNSPAWRAPREALEWARQAAGLVRADLVQLDGMFHTVKNIRDTFKGTGHLVRWIAPKSQTLREEQF